MGWFKPKEIKIPNFLPLQKNRLYINNEDIDQEADLKRLIAIYRYIVPDEEKVVSYLKERSQVIEDFVQSKGKMMAKSLDLLLFTNQDLRTGFLKNVQEVKLQVHNHFPELYKERSGFKQVMVRGMCMDNSDFLGMFYEDNNDLNNWIRNSVLNWYISINLENNPKLSEIELLLKNAPKGIGFYRTLTVEGYQIRENRQFIAEIISPVYKYANHKKRFDGLYDNSQEYVHNLALAVMANINQEGIEGTENVEEIDGMIDNSALKGGVLN